MACFRPLHGYRSTEGGGRVTQSRSKAYIDQPLVVPCGQCIGCRLERSRQWALRLYHESTLHQVNTFVTLTYDDEHLPEDGGLRVKDWQHFAKRARKKLGQFRYYHCGEYGERTLRPHYHAILFGIRFPDTKHAPGEQNPRAMGTSNTLRDLWGLGHCTVGEVNESTISYVASYVIKKLNGELAENEYDSIDPHTGEVIERKRPYATMSLKPGIGRGYYDKWKGQIYPRDECVWKGKTVKPPRYYDELYKLEEPEAMKGVTEKRRIRAESNPQDLTPDRLAVREEVKRTNQTRRLREPEA